MSSHVLWNHRGNTNACTSVVLQVRVQVVDTHLESETNRSREAAICSKAGNFDVKISQNGEALLSGKAKILHYVPQYKTKDHIFVFHTKVVQLGSTKGAKERTSIDDVDVLSLVSSAF